VEENHLLLAVRRIVNGVEIKSQSLGRYGKRGDELINEAVAQSFQGG
jgi:hypothetical protein